MPYDDDKRSRLSQRSFGVTNRIWILLAFFLFIITFSHYALPAASNATPATRPQFLSTKLKPKNYLNLTDTEANPFSFCPAYGPNDELAVTYGAQALLKTRTHIGTGERIQRVLNKALAGQPVTISIIGGSVSACHGAGDDPVAPNCYPARFFNWWNTVFPHPATELTNGAMRRTNSGYFGYCSAHHIPDVTDLVIIELDSDDILDPDMLENFETLVRSILIRPDQPAVLLLGHFTPQMHQAHGFAGPEHAHNIVAQFYDVPHLTTKPIHYPKYIENPQSMDAYFVDPVLANPAGHEVLADVLITFLQSQICEAWDVATGASYSPSPESNEPESPSDAHGLFGGVGQRKGLVPEPGAPGADADTNANADSDMDERGRRLAAVLQNVRKSTQLVAPVPAGRINSRPGGRINSRPGGRAFQEIAPYCVSANDLINPLPPSMFYGSGWNVFHAPSEGGTLRTTSHYWYSTLPTSKLRVPIQVGAGDIGVYYLREPIRKVGEGSAVDCWVDDNYAGAKTIENAADIDEETPALMVIDHFVTRGSHFVECVVNGEEGQGVPMFKIIGIFST
ncbi:hypothetical protein H0H92_001882 [Tricholoma furcatifolium]|nr:hypothetical protein H0H92_001882 [Tricholoma furcatifolium]